MGPLQPGTVHFLIGSASHTGKSEVTDLIVLKIWRFSRINGNELANAELTRAESGQVNIRKVRCGPNREIARNTSIRNFNPTRNLLAVAGG